jgi:hypothetical protein
VGLKYQINQSNQSISSMFSEFAANGSLYDYLKKDKNMLDFAHIVRWAREIAQGMIIL